MNISEKELRLKEINDRVLDVLGKHKDEIIVIKTKDEFKSYIDSCINNGYIAIDTETHNSTDVCQTKIMGLCLYSKGLKGAYVPINHRDYKTLKRLDWQLNESDIKEELERIKESKTFVIMHNSKFDYEILKFTCGIEIPSNWDTMVAAQLLNENESMSLKEQYIRKFDPTQEQYKIDKLFKDFLYADVDPSIFALYSAFDAIMTYRLYEYQFEKMNEKDNEKIYKLFKEVEMPITIITADIETFGINVDKNFSLKLKDKYSKELEEIDKKIDEEMIYFEPHILKWRASDKSKQHVYNYETLKDRRKNWEYRVSRYPEVDPQNGVRYKYGKQLGAILKDSINYNSSVQLAVLLYDVFEVVPMSSICPRGTGTPILKDMISHIKEFLGDVDKRDSYLKEDEEDGILKDELVENDDIEDEGFDEDEDNETQNIVSEELDEKDDDKKDKNKLISKVRKLEKRECYKDKEYIKHILSFIELLVERRKINKLMSSYLETIPKLCDHWNDGLIRYSMNSLGTKTGRYSSGGKIHYVEDDEQKFIPGLNMQNIPADSNHEIRLQFTARPDHILISGDFKQQEPKLAAYISQDKRLKDSYKEGKDIYAVIAQSAYNNKYEDNLEFFPGTETLNKEGKKRRKTGKQVVLASLYGMGPATAAKKMEVSVERAREILDSFFRDFYKLDAAIKTSQKKCRLLGYVEDICGRRRRLPDLLKPYFNIQYINNPNKNRNNPDDKILSYLNRLEKDDKVIVNNDEFRKIYEEGLKENILITSNIPLIKKAQRQCFNSIIQGSAASLTKFTMIQIYNDKTLRDLDAHMIIQVHDEVILECPIENVEKVSERLSTIMNTAGAYLGIDVAMSCDIAIEKRWGANTISTDIVEKYKELKSDMSDDEAMNQILDLYPEFPETSLRKLISGEVDCIDF